MGHSHMPPAGFPRKSSYADPLYREIGYEKLLPYNVDHAAAMSAFQKQVATKSSNRSITTSRVIDRQIDADTIEGYRKKD